MKKQIFKTDDFFVENKKAKKSNLQNVENIVLKKILDFNNKERKKSNRKIQRLSKRKNNKNNMFFYFSYIDDQFTVEIKPNKIKDLELNTGFLIDQNSGVFYGTKERLIKFIESKLM